MRLHQKQEEKTENKRRDNGNVETTTQGGLASHPLSAQGLNLAVVSAYGIRNAVSLSPQLCPPMAYAWA